jgi:hypothetical protein
MKHFLSAGELLRVIAGIGINPEFRQLKNFWLFRYQSADQ